MKRMSYELFASNLNLSQGDRIFVSSDISRLAFSWHLDGEVFNANLFIESIMNVIGEDGTLVFPTYNWGFCKGIDFNYCETPSKVGALTNVALKREDFTRTKHPIYSFAVWGKDTRNLYALENKSSFGGDSPFAYFYDNHFTNLIIDLGFEDTGTFVHYCEEKIGVPYRLNKDFTSGYIDETGTREMRTYSMYVRPLDIEVGVAIAPMNEVFFENNVIQADTVCGIRVELLNMRKAYDLIEFDILNNRSRRIAAYPGQ